MFENCFPKHYTRYRFPCNFYFKIFMYSVRNNAQCYFTNLRAEKHITIDNFRIYIVVYKLECYFFIRSIKRVRRCCKFKIIINFYK